MQLFQEVPTPREAVRAAQRDQLLRAMLEVVAEKGFAGTTITEVVKRARVSTRTFYELFEDKEDCFLAAYDLAVAYLDGRIAVARAAAAEGDFVAGVRAVLEEYLGALAEQPDLARVVLVEVLGAGRKAWARRDRALEARVALIAGGDEGGAGTAATTGDPPHDSLLAVLGAAEELARARLRAGALADLPALAPLIARMLPPPESG